MTGTFAAGAYTATYDADNAIAPAAGKGEGPRGIGIVQDVHWWQRTMTAVPIESNLVAATAIDAIYTGGTCFCRFTVKEWTAAVRGMLWPLDDSLTGLGPLGARLSQYAGELRLVAEEGTLAEEHGPAAIRFGKAIVAPGHPLEIPLGRIERDVPVLLQCFPYVTPQGKTVWFEIE